VFEMFVIGFSGANAMPKWALFSGMTSFSVTKADWNYSQEGENSSAGYKDQDIIRNIRQSLQNLVGKVSWFGAIKIIWHQNSHTVSGSHEFYWI